MENKSKNILKDDFEHLINYFQLKYEQLNNYGVEKYIELFEHKKQIGETLAKDFESFICEQYYQFLKQMFGNVNDRFGLNYYIIDYHIINQYTIVESEEALKDEIAYVDGEQSNYKNIVLMSANSYKELSFMFISHLMGIRKGIIIKSLMDY